MASFSTLFLPGHFREFLYHEYKAVDSMTKHEKARVMPEGLMLNATYSLCPPLFFRSISSCPFTCRPSEGEINAFVPFIPVDVQKVGLGGLKCDVGLIPFSAMRFLVHDFGRCANFFFLFGIKCFEV